MVLADLGARVIKVEKIGTGDDTREFGPFVEGESAYFSCFNRNKESIVLDIKSPRDRELLERLLDEADVLVENFRPGVMDRLGYGPERLARTHPHLIYSSISGFGHTGPDALKPAYDMVVQARGGVMSITGAAETAPYRVGYPLADTIGGMTAAFSIAAALNARPRGAFLDIAMTEAVISTMGWVVSNYLIGGVLPAAHGNENTTSAPSGTFITADKPINIAANRDSQWEDLARHLGREDLLAHADYRSREDRKRNRHALRAALEDTLRQRPAAEWVRELNALGVPAGLVLSVPEALDDTQIKGRGLIGKVPTGAETLALAGSPAMIDGMRPQPSGPPPALGADNQEIWQSLGLSADEIAELQKDGVI